MRQCGGFLTRRYREPYLHFTLESPDGSKKAVFLDFADGKPRLNKQVFAQLGVELLAGSPIILDEIGGMELLQPEFKTPLEQTLQQDIPIIGVMKGAGPASALIETLGLSHAYELAATALWDALMQDPDTLVYECGQFDENALRLAEQWAEEYLHE